MHRRDAQARPHRRDQYDSEARPYWRGGPTTLIHERDQDMPNDAMQSNAEQCSGSGHPDIRSLDKDKQISKIDMYLAPAHDLKASRAEPR